MHDSATHAWADTAKDGHAQLYQGEMKPVDDGRPAVWRKAVALPMAPQEVGTAKSRKARLLTAGAVVAGALAVGGWSGYQYLEGQVRSGCVLRVYDATSPADTASYAENVFTGRVVEFVERRVDESWTTDVYRVDVVSVLRGDVRGTVLVPFAPDRESARRLVDGETYVFATQAKADDGYWLMFQGEMEPVDDGQLLVWKAAVALAGEGEEGES